MQATGVGRTDEYRVVAPRVSGETVDPERFHLAEWVVSCLESRGAARPGPAAVAALAERLTTRLLSRGELAFREGDRDAGVWIVRSGRLELAVKGRARPLIVQILRPGGVDGDIQKLLGMPFPYRARALEDSECLTLAPHDFEELLGEHPEMSRLWMSTMAERLSESHDRIVGMLGRTLTQQSARLLLDEASGGVVDVPQQKLSEMLGVCRPSLNKVLKELEGHGLIRLRYGAVDILDPYGLAQRAD
ncbi:Crp/Fnr family transcriptional regulator [Nocardiopsis sp. CNR-923]|uniref:Crp/Fnr family transcriptional regulator n=1 Tax=Nocardiopsis sp. CNR-923 TaxID=1904965 RepID=UPI0021CC6F61|nr:Crp/Fnr family transcriptional regulator [Nocardiopsis sp. CNR-923]